MKDKLTICGFTLAIIAGIALLLIAADILTVDKDGTVKFRVRDTGAIGLERLSANPASLNDGDVWHAPTQYTDLGSGYEYTMPVVKYADNGATRPLAPMTDADLTLYVDASRPDDSGNGLTPATAKKSIQSAVNLIPPVVRHNVTIDVAAGTYTATGGTIGSSTSNVVVSGKDVAQGVGITFQGDLVNDPLADPPVLDRIVDGNGKNNCFYVNGVSNVVIKGLQVKNSTDRGIFYATFASGTVENCAVSSIGSNGVGIGVNNYMFSKVNVTNSLIRNCGANAIS